MSEVMKTLGVIILILAVIGSFFLNSTAIITVSVLFSSVIVSGIVFSIGCALEYLRRIAIAAEKAAGIVQKDRPTASIPHNTPPIVKRIPVKNFSLGLKVCPKCGAENQGDVRMCFDCGAFLSDTTYESPEKSI